MFVEDNESSDAIPQCILANSLRHGQFIKSLNPSVDNMMNGGIRAGVITEFVGESGSGKTQLCLQVALNVQLPPTLGGLYGVAMYYCCDYNFPISRLKAMKEAINKKFEAQEELVSLDNVMVCKVGDCEELRFKLELLERLCIQRADTDRHVRAVVIDCFASLFRSQFENTGASMAKRAKYFTHFSTKLNTIANKYNVATVMTNQVTDDFSGTTYTSNNQPLVSVDGTRIVPALGMAWANCVHNRVFLKICPRTNDEEKRRSMQLIYSSYLP